MSILNCDRIPSCIYDDRCLCFSSCRSRELLKQTRDGSWIKITHCSYKQETAIVHSCVYLCLSTWFFFCVCVDRWCTSRARKSPRHSSRSSPCSWTSSRRRSAQCRRRWRPWWLASLSRATPLKPSRRCVTAVISNSQIWLVKQCWRIRIVVSIGAAHSLGHIRHCYHF